MSRRRVFNANERFDEMVAMIKQEMGHRNDTETFYYCVGMTFKKTFPAHIKATGSFSDPAIVDKEKAKEKSDTILATSPYPKGLDGEVVEELDGKYCVFKTYNRTSVKEQKIPLSLVSKDIVNNQYKPSYDKVQELLKGKK